MFGIADYPAFCAAIVVFLALPGPGTFALLTSTAKGGFRAGAAATMGVILGDQFLLWLAVAGVATVMATYPAVFAAVRWLGAAYLSWMGLKLLLNRGQASAQPVKIEPRAYLRQALIITVLNPKAIVFYMAFFPLFLDPSSHQGLTTFVAMALTIAAITAGWCLSLCALASALADRVRRLPSLVRWLERLAGICLIAFGARLLKS